MSCFCRFLPSLLPAGSSVPVPGLLAALWLFLLLTLCPCPACVHAGLRWTDYGSFCLPGALPVAFAVWPGLCIVVAHAGLQAQCSGRILAPVFHWVTFHCPLLPASGHRPGFGSNRNYFLCAWGF